MNSAKELGEILVGSDVNIAAGVAIGIAGGHHIECEGQIYRMDCDGLCLCSIGVIT
jgi:hypothetical protein